jgi:hypothetical protein
MSQRLSGIRRTGRRRSTRTVSVVPVRLWTAGSEDSDLAHTLDVRNHGVKFGGCQGEFKVGDKIEVLYRHKHTQPELLGSLLARAPQRSELGLSSWSRKNRCRVWSSPSKRTNTKKRIEAVESSERHDYSTRVLARTGNIAAVMRSMGHRDVRTAMHYQHPELEIVRAALDSDSSGDTPETGISAE